ncbi:hypothetical protein MF451_003748 [Salmonella enterica subsp. enterica serovar Saintpaul]|nr:hypothetical protein [Salmonella enterica subsp. enterica serovar Saintpaul]
MQSKLLTPEANEAFNWMIDRMPDRVFNLFAQEMDAALRDAAERFGLNNELIEAFRVKRLIPAREPLLPADDDQQVYQAHIFTGDKTYAVIGNGKIYRKSRGGVWKPAEITLEEVQACSITRVPGSITIKAKYL